MKIVIVKIARGVNSYGQALNALHKMAAEMKQPEQVALQAS
jgi:hypothetical protein